ncbi:MAG TPA: HD domain-containing phosphohydrolase [Syntrophomonadaceae bacterium]|nr:HD domain-containing phosphohydrolase [Syntrophomonadaceae bacterium]
MLKKAVPLSSLPIGEPIAQSIFDGRDRLLLKQGSILTQSFIARLESNDIDSVFIAVEIKETPKNKAKSIKSKFIPPNFHTLYDELLYEQDRIELRGNYIKPIQTELLTEINGLIELIKIDPEMSLDFFMKMKSSQTDYQYDTHHVNSAILAILIGIWLDLDSRLLKEITVTAMLHDIGETRIPPDILKKPGKLNDSELNIVKTHPTLGTQILSKTDWINNRELYGVLTHHERLNGQGYPYNLLGSKITIHSRVTAVASIFNTATTDRPYSRAKNIIDILLELRNRSFGELDSKVTRVLYDKILEYLQKNEKIILLNNGDKGHLKRINIKGPKLLITGENGVYDLDDINAPKIISIS